MFGLEVKIDGAKSAILAYAGRLDEVSREALIDGGGAAIDSARQTIERTTKRHTGSLEDDWRTGWKSKYERVVTNFSDHARLIDEGTKPHRIVARRAKVLAFQFAGGMMFRRAVNHPGTQPRPFVALAQAAGQMAMKASAQDGADRIARQF